ncbi:MAG: hypothetical protein KDA75_14100 [Planctomycetaceae bacterium]|nr:hypothetical protein [Planctomycetaceae bacterium]
MVKPYAGNFGDGVPDVRSTDGFSGHEVRTTDILEPSIAPVNLSDSP